MSKKFNGQIRCMSCKENIEGQIVCAMGNTYHPEHFICTICQEPIKGDRFQVKNGQPYCEDDYAENFLPKCYACDDYIHDRVIKALGRNYHEEHFVCRLCERELAALNFIDKDGEPICQKCYNQKYADKCKGCGKPIIDKIVLALYEKWHPECFKCSKCSQPVFEETFQVEAGRPLCSRCS